MVVNGLTKTRLQRIQLNTRLNLSGKRVNLVGYFQKQPSRGVLKKRYYATNLHKNTNVEV